MAFVCATGGKRLRVLNGGGYGGSLLELSTLRPEDLGGNGKPKCGGEVRFSCFLLGNRLVLSHSTVVTFCKLSLQKYLPSHGM